MTPPFVSQVHLPGIAPVEYREIFRQVIRLMWNHNGVNVVGHQAVGPEFDRPISRQLQGHFQVDPVVGPFKEGSLTTDAALGDVVRVAWNHQPGKSWHVPATV